MKKKVNFTKDDIVEHLVKKKGYSKLFSKKLIDNLLESIIQEIKENKLNLKKIGSFNIINKKERVGRNPKTMKEVLIKSRRTVKFVPSKELISNLNA
tara:strand:- start:5611 stop:5901 length:291 start_codon:yes stop_codon:yes gene_type:complete